MLHNVFGYEKILPSRTTGVLHFCSYGTTPTELGRDFEELPPRGKQEHPRPNNFVLVWERYVRNDSSWRRGWWINIFSNRNVLHHNDTNCVLSLRCPQTIDPDSHTSYIWKNQRIGILYVCVWCVLFWNRHTLCVCFVCVILKHSSVQFQLINSIKINENPCVPAIWGQVVQLTFLRIWKRVF